MALTYTTNAAFEAYVPGWVTDSPSALTALLERAERDVDSILGPVPRDGLTTTGLKFDPTKLKAWEATALSRAVCAQAEYRLAVGETNLVAGRLTKMEKGPDFEVIFADSPGGPGANLLGPKVAVELAPIRHLRRLTGYLV